MIKEWHRLPSSYNSAHPYCQGCERPWPCQGVYAEVLAALDATMDALDKLAWASYLRSEAHGTAALTAETKRAMAFLRDHGRDPT